MTRLIVNTKDAPAEAVAKILATWAVLAREVEKRATLLSGCELEWELTFHDANYRVDWEAYSVVRMVFPARVEQFEEVRHVNVPLTDVHEIFINNDGTFSWHSEGKSPQELPEVIDRIATAISTGKLPKNFRYGVNHIPTL